MGSVSQLIIVNVTFFDEDELKQMNKNMTKKYIKEKIYTKAFEDLRKTQSMHSKVKDIKYEKFTCQEYRKSAKFSFEEAPILVALRSKTVKDIKSAKMTCCVHFASKVWTLKNIV